MCQKMAKGGRASPVPSTGVFPTRIPLHSSELSIGYVLTRRRRSRQRRARSPPRKEKAPFFEEKSGLAGSLAR